MKGFSLLMRLARAKSISFGLIFAIVAFVISNQSFDLNSSLFKGDKKYKEIYGKVVKVVDGDTIDILDVNKTKYRIRFSGIDAPESKQAFGQKAKQFLASMIAGKKVKAIVDSNDKYGRNVATVFLDGANINQAMVRNGFAWAYRSFSTKYIEEEAYARRNRLGLWRDLNPINPADFRKQNKKY